MAKTHVADSCIRCGNLLSDGDEAIYIGRAKLTKAPTTQSWQTIKGEAVFNQPKKLKPGMIRIQHHPGKPKHLMCLTCYSAVEWQYERTGEG